MPHSFREDRDVARHSSNRTSPGKPAAASTGSGSKPHIKLPEQLLSRAVELHQSGKLSEARDLYEQILQQSRKNANALHLLGVLLHQQGKHEESISYIEQALEQQPDAILFRKNLASSCRAVGDTERAQKICEEILATEPQELVVSALLGRIHEDASCWNEAIKCYSTVVEHTEDQANQIETLNRLGDCYSRNGQSDEAIKCFRRVKETKPKNLVATHNLARELQFQNRMTEAEEFYHETIQIDRTCASAWNNLGVIYQSAVKYDDALACFEKARELMPQLPDVHNNLANVREAMGSLEGNRELFAHAIKLRPEYAEPHHSLSQIELREGNFKRGWPLYQWRHKKGEHDHRPYRHPKWDGTPLTDEHLLVFSEQGVGDVVMFATCLPQLTQYAKHITLEIDGRMIPLFSRTFPQLRFIPRPAIDPPQTITLPGIDCQISLGDLPGFYRHAESDFPRQPQLLRPNPTLKQKWEARFKALGHSLKIGISWTGGKNAELKKRRSISLEHWNEILKLDSIQWINLQYGQHETELEQIRQKTGVMIHDWPDSDPLRDLDDFAAQLSALDLVISIDNATVHFGGAVGVPTWALLNKIPDWRWMNDRTDSLWYESLQLFRQSTHGDWNPVLQHVKQQLQEMLAKHNPRLVQAVEESHIPVRQPVVPQALPTQIVVNTQPRCAIISPVGPGHQEIYRQAEQSIKTACRNSPGRFSNITPFRIDDLQGEHGRSKARNFAVQQAANQGFDWVFFLDADDVMVPEAFANAEPYLENYDAIWGQIFSFQQGSQEAHQREGQLAATQQFTDVLNSDPYHALQMGHFVRTEVALQNPFDEAIDVGEDYDYYLRVWEKYRCIKIDRPFFANRRGLHSTGPRSGTGREWTVRVNQMVQEYRKRQKKTVSTVSTPPWRPAHKPAMKLAIYGMMRSGTTLLCDKLTVPDKGLVLLEPNIHMTGRPDQVREQLAQFGIDISPAEWQRGCAQGSFRDYFEKSIRPRLEQLDYWGVKMVNFSEWESFLNDYPAEHLILCVRDIRDVVLSALDLVPKLEHHLDDQWIEKRALETASSLVEMSKRPHHLVRYEDVCQHPEQIDQLAASLGLPTVGENRLSLAAVPHRLYEEEKHGRKVSAKSVMRHRTEPAGRALELANKIWQQCDEYCERFGYETFQKPTSVFGSTSQKSAEKLASFWQQDHLANIIPQNQSLGAFPEGWDVRPFLGELLPVTGQQRVLEIGCGYGRLCQAFRAENYLGIDVNPEAIQTAQTSNEQYQFETIGFSDPYPQAEAILLYTVLLHIDDLNIGPMLTRICQAGSTVLIAEILGRQRWRRSGNPPVFNRDLEDYVGLMQDQGFVLQQEAQKAYEHYPNTNISFLKFTRK